MRRIKYQLIRGTVYKFDLMIGIGISTQEFVKHMEDNFEDGVLTNEEKDLLITTHKGIGGRVIMLEDSHALLMWLRKFPDSPENFACLSHEIFHAADMIIRQIGIKHSDECDEAVAHLISWYTESIYTHFKLS